MGQEESKFYEQNEGIAKEGWGRFNNRKQKEDEKKRAKQRKDQDEQWNEWKKLGCVRKNFPAGSST